MSAAFSLLSLAQHLLRTTFSNKSCIRPCLTFATNSAFQVVSCGQIHRKAFTSDIPFS